MTPDRPDMDLTAIFERDDWPQRLRAAVEATIADRQARRDLRQQLAAARDAGLERRHATKLGRREGHQVSDVGAPTTASQVETVTATGSTMAATTTVATVTPTDANPPATDDQGVNLPLAQVAALARLRRAGQGGWRPRRDHHD